jgi:drug/metabolite transporter (DMT)-like permease
MWNSIGYVAQAIGLATTSASKSAFLCSLAVVMVPILDFLAGRSLATRQVIGALLAVVGVGFLEFEGASSFQQALALEPGDICSMIQPIAFGLGFWRMESLMQKYPKHAGRGTAGQLLAVFLGSAEYMGVMGTTDPSTVPGMDQFLSWVQDPAILGALFWTGVVTTALTIYMETVALKTLSAAETTLLFSTEPLWGTAFASVVMGEQLGISAALGGVMILSGCIFSNLGLKGLIQFLPGQQNGSIETIEEVTNNELEGPFEFMSAETAPPVKRGVFPTHPLAKFSLKSGVAGTLASFVASAQASATSTVVPEELTEFLENLPH